MSSASVLLPPVNRGNWRQKDTLAMSATSPLWRGICLSKCTSTWTSWDFHQYRSLDSDNTVLYWELVITRPYSVISCLRQNFIYWTRSFLFISTKLWGIWIVSHSMVSFLLCLNTVMPWSVNLICSMTLGVMAVFMFRWGRMAAVVFVTRCRVCEPKQNFAKYFCSWTNCLQTEAFVHWVITVCVCIYI